MSQKRRISKVQINLPTEVLEKSENKAVKMGFSSVQDLIRVFLVNINNQNFEITFMPKQKEPVEYITSEYEAYLDQRLKETEEAISSGTAYTANSADELITQLESEDEKG